MRHLRRNGLAATALVVIALAVIGALAAPWLPLVDPDTVETASRLKPPGSPGHPLGTDEFGRDLLSRLIWGARVSLLAGVGTAAAAMGLGVSLGLLAGYYRGWVESLIMRFTDILMAFPFILLAIAVIGVLAVERIGIDDPIGAVAVHGMSGIWGTIACGLFTAPRLMCIAVAISASDKSA